MLGLILLDRLLELGNFDEAVDHLGGEHELIAGIRRMLAHQLC
jgi:hypothetical protein